MTHTNFLNSLIRRLTAAFVSLLLASGIAHAICPITPARVSVGDQASDDACTYNDIQSALDAQGGSCRVVVDITREHTYTSQALTISGKSLTLQGWGDGVTCSALSQCEQLKNCTPPDSDGPLVTLSGKTGNSVLYINGSSNVTLDNLEITGGILDSTQGGGGINFSGTGSLTLSDTTVQNNNAGYGGGIAMNPSGAATLTLEPNTVIQYNAASVNGGGLLIEGQTNLVATASNLYINGNTAPNGDGGGIILVDPATADIGSPGYFGLPVIYQNSAAYGGGIAAEGSQHSLYNGRLRLFSTDPAHPVSVSGNFASHTGGGIYLRPFLGDTFNAINLCAYDFRIDDNSAQEGAAIYADVVNYFSGHVYLNLDPANDSSVVCNRSQLISALAAVPCGTGVACNELDDNIAEDINQNPTDGATILVQTGGYLRADRVSLRENQGGEVIRFLTDLSAESAQVELHDCLIADNVLTGPVIDAEPGGGEGTQLIVDSCTLANNNDGDEVFAIVAHLNFAELTNSIISPVSSQPYQPTIDFNGPSGDLTARYVLSNDTSTLVGGTGIQLGAPTFVDAGNGNYHLQRTSLGVDFAPAGSTSLDLDSHTRPVDLPGVQNFYGPLDLGAYEIQSACVVSDTIFCDGFDGS